MAQTSFFSSLSHNATVLLTELSANATRLATELFSNLRNANSADTKQNAAAFTQRIVSQVNATFVKLQNTTYVAETLDTAKTRIVTMDRGLFYAYIALMTMAVLPIIFGSFGSIKFKPKKSDKKSKDTDSEDEFDKDETEFFSLEEAKMFPIYGSFTLLSLYILFTYFNKEYINYLMTAYFGIIGVGSFSQITLDSFRLVSGLKLKGDYKVHMYHKNKEFFFWRFGAPHLTAFVISIFVNVYYVLTKQWIVSNALAEAFSITAVQLLNLDSFSTGMVLLAALFIYDIFWVFGTDVMVTVAKNFDAPVKVTWPKDISALLTEGLFNKVPSGTQFTMLGLGDIVIPGIYICLCLQFDYYLYKRTAAGKKNPNTLWFPKPYFHTVLTAYIVGLITTVLVMHGFQSAQPALLYLSPACILSSFFLALFRGELIEMFKYEREGASSANKQKNPTPKKQKKKSHAKVEESSKVTPAVVEKVEQWKDGLGDDFKSANNSAATSPSRKQKTLKKESPKK